MKKNEKAKGLYLINLLKFRDKDPESSINIENEFKHKNQFLKNQLTILSSKSLYIQELERLAKQCRDNLSKQNKKVVIKQKSHKNFFDKINKLMKVSCNKMILDFIYNNPKIKNHFLSYDKINNEKYKIKSKISSNDSLPNYKYKFEKCHTDSLNLLSNKNQNKNFHQSLSFFTPKNNNLFHKRKIPIIKAFNSEAKNNIFNSQQHIKSYKPRETKIDDELKGMLAINYNNNINKMINIGKLYSKFKSVKNLKL